MPAISTHLIHATGNAAMGGVWLTIAAACGLTAALFGARQFLAGPPALRPELQRTLMRSRSRLRAPSQINAGSNVRVEEMLRREGSAGATLQIFFKFFRELLFRQRDIRE